MLHRLRFCSTEQQQTLINPSKQKKHEEEEEEEEERIYRLITTSSLHSIPLPLPSSLIDRLLKRLRFSHRNPLQTLSFFSLAASSTSQSLSPFSYNTMLFILGRSRLFPQMWLLLLQMKRKDPILITPTTIHIVLARISKICSVRHTAFSFLNLLRLSPPPLHTHCFNSLLRSLSQEKSMLDATNIYHQFKHRFPPNLQTFNILLSGYRSSQQSESFFKEMIDIGVHPDLVSYNCLIDSYCKSRRINDAYKVLDEMRERGFSPDVFTYTSFIGGLGLVGRPDEAEGVLKEMREGGCAPDAAAYNAAIRNYCIAKRMGKAFALMEEMRGRGLVPNPTTYNLFFRCFYWANELENSWRRYGRMRREGCLPNTQSCMFLVRMCRRQEKVGLALELWDDMVRNGFGSPALVSDVLFDLLCDLGKLDEAERCFVQMVGMRHKPSSVSFRRIRVLMELAGRQHSVTKLEEMMMAGFEEAAVRDNNSLEMPHSEFLNL